MRFRNLFKDVAIYGFGDVLIKCFSIVTLPIYTRIFTPEDFGILSFVTTLAGLLAQFLSLGAQSSYARYFFEVQTLPQRKLLTSTLLIFCTVWSFSLTLLFLPFAGLLSQWFLGKPDYAILLTLSLLTNPLALLNDLSGQTLRNQFQAKLFSILNLLTAILGISITLYTVLVLKLGILGFILASLLVTVIMLPIRLWTIRNFLSFTFSVAKLRELLAYGIPLVPMSLAYWIFLTSDRLVLGALSTLEQLGLYSVANNITSVLGFLNSALGQAFSPHAVEVYETERDFAPTFMGQSMTYILAGFGFLCLGTTAFSYEALVILSTPKFYAASLAVGPLTLGFLALASTQITAAGISFAKKTYYFTIFSWIAAILNLVFNVLLVPEWGMLASSWTTAGAYIFLTIAYYLVAQKLWAVKYEKRKAIITLFLTVFFIVVVPFIPSFNLPINLLIKSLFCLSYLILLFALKVLDLQQWKQIITSISSSKLKT